MVTNGLELFQEFTIVGGDYQELHFTVVNQFNEPINLAAMQKRELKISTTSIPQRTVITKNGTVYETNNVKFTLESDETKAFRGKYTFQLILTEKDGVTTFIPSQGIMNIYPQIGV